MSKWRNLTICLSTICTNFMFFFSNSTGALKLARRACVIPRVKTDYFDQNESVQDRLYKNLRIWTVFVDLEESLGTFEVS